MEKPGIDLLHLVFFNKQPGYKQLALARQIANTLSGLNPLSLSNNKNYRLKRNFLCKKHKIAVKPNIHQTLAVSKHFKLTDYKC